MHDVRDRGIRAIVDETVAIVGDGAGVPDRGRRRARPGVRTGNGHARARWDDERRPALGLPRARVAPADRRHGRRRGDPDRRRVGRRHGARRRADRPRGADRASRSGGQYPGSEPSGAVQLQTSRCGTIPALRHESASRFGKPVRIPCLHAYQAPSGSDLGGWVATHLPTTPARWGQLLIARDAHHHDDGDADHGDLDENHRRLDSVDARSPVRRAPSGGYRHDAAPG